jgi:NHS family xanthosine MFS transporter
MVILDGLWMIIMSCVVYGMAFDFFNISGSLFIETTTTLEYVLAQGLFMMMSNGLAPSLVVLSAGLSINFSSRRC